MEDVQLVALDMDGTTLLPDLTIAQQTKEKISACIAKGTAVTICTGRTLAELKWELEELGDVPYVITGNGSAAWCLRDGIKLYEDTVSYDDAMHIMEILRPYDMRIEVYYDGKVFVNQHVLDHIVAYGATEFPEFILETRTAVEDIYAFMEKLQQPIDKFNLFFKSSTERQAAWDACVVAGYNVTSSFLQNMEVNSKTANKGNALKHLAQSLHIPAQAVMAVGDQLNDVSMLTYAGVPVAMGNAVSEVKELAVFITKSNADNGVAYALERYVLGGQA